MAIEQFVKKKQLNGSLDDQIITTIDFDRNTKKLVSFCVLQILFTGEQAHEVVKFDAAHGYCHVHRYYKRLGDPGKRLLGRDISQDVFNRCRADIEKNWRKYRQWYVKKWLE